MFLKWDSVGEMEAVCFDRSVTIPGCAVESDTAVSCVLSDVVKNLLVKVHKPPSDFKAASFYRLASQFSNIDGGYILKNVNAVSILS